MKDDMEKLKFEIVRGLLAGRIKLVEVNESMKFDRIYLDIRAIRTRGTKADDPLILALLDYVFTDNFASLAVVLDEEASRIDAELSKPVTRDDLTRAGFWFEENFACGPDNLIFTIGVPGFLLGSTVVTKRILAALTH